MRIWEEEAEVLNEVAEAEAVTSHGLRLIQSLRLNN